MSLRREAEARLRKRLATSKTTLVDPAILAHELEVHEIELAMQNEELRSVVVALDESRARYKELFDLAPLAYVELSSQGVVLEANAAAGYLLGVPGSALVGGTLHRFVSPDSSRLVKHYGDLVKSATGSASCELELQRADGGRRAVMMHSTRTAGLRIRSALSDVTEIRDAERAARHAERMQAIGTLASAVAHDFNNLLMGVLGSAARASRLLPGDPERARDAIDDLVKTVRSGAALAKQILQVAHGTAVNKRLIRLDEALLQLREMLGHLVGEGVRIDLRLAARGAYVELPGGALEQIMLNVAVNARDAMPHNGELVMETQLVDLDAHAASTHGRLSPGRYVLLSARDTGTGMDAETLARAFEPFFTTKDPGRGTGLGLSTIRNIVESVGGHADLTSLPGHGTLLRMYIPALGSARAVASESLRPPVVPRAVVALVVDDDPLVRSAVRLFLESAGHRVLEACDAAQALSMPGLDAVEVLITDLMLSGPSGVQIARTLAQHRPQIAVVYMTGHWVPALRERGQLPKQALALEKPFDGPQLLAAVAEAILREPPKDT